MGRTLALVLASVLATGLLPTGAAPQIPDLTWYLLNVATASEPTPVSGGGLTDDTRFRGMLDWARGEIRLEIAYEHTLGLWENDPLNSNLIFGAGGGAGDWLGLQGNISSWDGGSWDHRVDRLSLSLPLGTEGEITVGRQAVSWATTLFLTPADPFAPFDPADPFREYRIGVDAARVRLYPGPFSELDLVVRPSRQAEGTTLTALARGRRSVAGWDVSGWAGLVHDELGAAGGVSGSAGEWAVRGEASLRRDRAGEGVVLRLSTGVDRLLDLADRDLYVLAEYQHDGWGASSADSLLTHGHRVGSNELPDPPPGGGRRVGDREPPGRQRPLRARRELVRGVGLERPGWPLPRVGRRPGHHGESTGLGIRPGSGGRISLPHRLLLTR